MEKFKTLADAIALAEFAHRNQVDKAAMDYIGHPKRVMDAVAMQGGLPYMQMAAVLHDVTEDTAFTPEILLDLGLPESAVQIVRLLDRGCSRQEFIDLNPGRAFDKKEADEYYYQQIRKNHGARIVKLADISDNLLPGRLVYLEEATQQRLLSKYAHAREILGREI